MSKLYRKYKRAIFKYLVEELGIDPEREDIGWYNDSEPLHYYVMRFEVDGVEYSLGYSKLDEEVVRL